MVNRWQCIACRFGAGGGGGGGGGGGASRVGLNPPSPPKPSSPPLSFFFEIPYIGKTLTISSQ